MLDSAKVNRLALVAALGIGLANVQSGAAEPNVLPGPVSSAAAPELAPAMPIPAADQVYTPPSSLRFLGGQRSSWSAFPLRSTSPIFMTSINYPGVYGAWYYGAAPGFGPTGMRLASPYTYRPSWTTLAPAWATPPSEPLPTVKLEPFPSLPTEHGNPATITIYTPEPASVWIGSQSLSGVGTENHFTTPQLRPNQLYSYEVTAMWSQDGVPVKESRTTVLQSGDRNVVSFWRKPVVNHNASSGTRVPD